MPRILGLGLLGLILLCFLCIGLHAPRIQAELQDEGRQRLTAAGFGAAASGARRGETMLEVRGRDAILTGWVVSADDRRSAVRIIEEIPGVRGVDNRLEVPEKVRFELSRSGEAVTMRGVLPSADHRHAVASRARDLWGGIGLVDELSVDSRSEAPAWLPGLPDALTAFSRRAQDGTLSIDEDQLTIGGRFFADSSRRALLERLGGTLPGLNVVDQSEVRPPETVAELQATLDTAVLSRTVEFASDSVELTPLGRSVLDEIFELLSSQEATRIKISGHTDDQGNDGYNLDLSRRRSQAARDYLTGKGLARGRFETQGFGETQPIADNTTPEGRLKNRRIEFDVLEESR